MFSKNFTQHYLLLVAILSATTAICQAEERVRWRNTLDAAKIEASQQNKLVLLHFWSSTCGPCRQLKENVFSQPHVAEAIEANYVPVKVNADNSSALASAYQVDRVPTDVVLSGQGNVVASLSCPTNPEAYQAQLTNLSNHYRQNTSGSNASHQVPVQSAYSGLQVGHYANQNNQSSAPPAQQQMPQQVQSQQSYGQSVTNNPYMTQSSGSPVQTAQQPGRTTNQNGALQSPTMPPNAMPNSYRQRQTTYNPPSATNGHQQHLQSPQNSQQQIAHQQVNQQPVQGHNEPKHPSVSHQAPQQYLQSQHPKVNQPQPPSSPNIQQPVPGGQLAKGTQPQQSSRAVTQDQLPAGTPPLGFEAYCPVQLKISHRWVPGDLQHGAIHRGRTYLFAGESEKQQFLANPDAYSPVFSGIDPVLLLDENQTVQGSRRYGFQYRGAFYLFASQDSMNKFREQPDRYASGVRQAMNQMEGSGKETVVR